MRKVNTSIEAAKNKVAELKGKPLRIRYNKGRNRISYFDGIIDEVYPSVFIVKVTNQLFDKLSCNYSDVLCGDIRFKLKTDNDV